MAVSLNNAKLSPLMAPYGNTPSSTSYRPRSRIFAKFCLVVLFLTTPAVVWAVGRQPTRTDGTYQISVGAVCTGRGHAVVGGGRILLQANVKDRAGTSGVLVAPAMVLDGDHFQGTGTVMGRPATFIGRLDGYDQDKKFRGARLLCSFTDSAGHSGRVAGVLTP